MRDFVAIDLETATSFRGSICEIGIAIVENGIIVDSKSWLVQPRLNRYDCFNVAVHGITPEMTADSPLFPVVWEEVLPYLNNKVVVAHNTSFDMYAIKDAIDDYGLTLPSFNYYCSLRIARKAFNGLYSYSLGPLCEQIGITFGTHHRAKDDAEGCAKVFLKALEELKLEDVKQLENALSIRKGQFDANGHYPQRALNKAYPKGNLLKSIVAEASQFDENNYFYGKGVCFTGAFSFGLRKNLLQAIAEIGGIPMDSVTKATNVLVVGQQDYRVVGAEGMSGKQKRALSLIEKGQDLEIMSEAEFLINFGVDIPKM